MKQKQKRVKNTISPNTECLFRDGLNTRERLLKTIKDNLMTTNDHQKPPQKKLGLISKIWAFSLKTPISNNRAGRNKSFTLLGSLFNQLNAILSLADLAIIGKEIGQRRSTRDAFLIILDPSSEIVGRLGYLAIAVIGLCTIVDILLLLG